MAQRREIPELWGKLLESKGISSLRHLAREADVAPTSVSRLVHGDGESADATIHAIAEVLGVDLPTMYRLAGQGAPEAAPYVPPAEANRLTARQRRAIDDLIRAITAGREDEDDATQTEDAQGNGEDVPGVGDRTPMSLDQARRVRDDPAAFGDQNRRGDMDRRQREADSRPLDELLDLAADKGDRMDDD